MFTSKKIVAVLVLGLLCIALGVWKFNSLYRKVKDIRSGYLAAEAYEQYSADPFDTAALEESARKAQSAIFLSPHNYQANRTLAAILMYVNPRTSLGYWEQSRELWQKPEPIPFSDQLNYVQELILNNRLEDAYNVLIGIRANEVEQSEIDYNLAKICILRGERDRAVEYGRRMAENRYTPIRRQLFFIGICFKSDDSAIRKEGERHIRVLVENEELIDDSVLWDLTQFRNLDPDLSAMLKERLDGKITAYDERVALAEYEVINGTKEPLKAYQELAERLFREDPLAVMTLAKWCSKHGLVDQVLELVTTDMALSRKDWFLLYVKNLGHKGKWDEVTRLLDNRDCPVEPFWTSILKAEAYSERGDDKGKAVNAWYRAKLTSQPMLNQYWLMIHLGDELGLHEDTADLIDQLVSLGAMPEQVLVYLCKRELDAGDYEQLYDTLTAYRTRYPERPDIVNDWAYYSILMDRVDESVLSAIDQLVEANPTQLRFHMTWALAQIKKSNYRQVLARLQQFDVDWMKLHPRWRFILALALGGVGEFDQANAYLEKVDLKIFNRYEQALYEKVFSRH